MTGLQLGSSAGVTVVLDCGGADADVDPELLKHLTIISPNESELANLTGVVILHTLFIVKSRLSIHVGMCPSLILLAKILCSKASTSATTFWCSAMILSAFWGAVKFNGK